MTASHKQLHNVVSEQLRADILEGRIKPGQWLRQMHIADELGVSQMPVREALKELAADGLVEHIPYRGVRVVAFAPQDVADLYTHRAALEGMAAGAAASQMSAKELKEVAAIQPAITLHMGANQLADYRRLNRQFHQTIYRASGRHYLIRTLDQLWTAFPTMLWSNFSQTAEQIFPERDANDHTEHERILAALQARSSVEAEAAMHNHVLSTAAQLMAALELKEEAQTT